MAIDVIMKLINVSAVKQVEDLKSRVMAHQWVPLFYLHCAFNYNTRYLQLHTCGSDEDFFFILLF